MSIDCYAEILNRLTAEATFINLLEAALVARQINDAEYRYVLLILRENRQLLH